MHLSKVTYIYIWSVLVFPWNRTHDIVIASAKHHTTLCIVFGNVPWYHQGILHMHHFVFTVPLYICVKVACMLITPDASIKTCPQLCLCWERHTWSQIPQNECMSCFPLPLIVCVRYHLTSLTLLSPPSQPNIHVWPHTKGKRASAQNVYIVWKIATIESCIYCLIRVRESK